MSYFCSPCQRLIPKGQRCEHWSIANALAGYSCPCGREGLAPDWDWHCMECHQDFPNRDAFFAHSHPVKQAKRAS